MFSPQDFPRAETSGQEIKQTSRSRVKNRFSGKRMDSGLSIIPMDLRHIQFVRGGPIYHSVDNSSPGIHIPPTTVLPEVVEISRSFRGQGTLITPYWPDAPWFPFMLERDPDPVPLPEDYFQCQETSRGEARHKDP